MKPITPIVFVLLAFSTCPTAGASASERNTAVQPVPRDAQWMDRHKDFVDLAKKGGIDVLFLGDSITDYWRSADKLKGGKAVWDAQFAPLHAANFGIGGDRTQHVLWRIENGELDSLRPKAVVLLIGTNNTGYERDRPTIPRNATAETIAGITAVVHRLKEKLPDARILLLAIFPRGQKNDPIRNQVKEVNAGIAQLSDGRNVRFLDIGARFLEPDGSLSAEVMPDLLHPSEKGYSIWAAAIKEPLNELLTSGAATARQ